VPGADADDTFAHQGRWRKSNCQPPASHAVLRSHQPFPTWMASLLTLWLPRPIPSGHALRRQFHAQSLNQYLPEGVLNEKSPSPIAMRSWLLQLHGVEVKSPALEAALMAFCVAQIGRSNEDIDLLQRSRHAYLSSLRYLQEDLAKPKSRLYDETLAACLVLSLYELAMPYPEAINAFLSHIEGAMTLLKLRGPDASATSLGHCIFQELRAHAVRAFCH